MPKQPAYAGTEYDLTREDSEISKLHNLIQEQEVKESDAVVWFEGDRDDRTAQAIKLMQSDFSPKVILSGGVEGPSDIPSWKMQDEFINAGISEGRIICDESTNTKEQAQNVIDQIEENDWKRAILVANPYHQLRAFLTFLAELKKRGLDDKVEMMSAPPEYNWFSKPNSA